MRCRKCGGDLDGKEIKCPSCGSPVAARIDGMMKTSTILISAEDTAGVYRSMQDVPEPLRKKLLRSRS